ncbi:MAG: hypothetical protein FJ290_21140 [Planctomycetes bacterium]|nr:hypothetical protein [Planctomycetota bacterium]
MAWRRSSEAGLNLDSLLDTMTNGVGILIVVLCLTQVEFSRLVGGSRSGDHGPVVSTGELSVLKDRLRELEAALRELQERWRLEEPRQNQRLVDMRHIGAVIAKLKELLKERPLPVDREAVLKETEKCKAELEKLKKDIAQRQKELLDLQEKLAALHKPVEPLAPKFRELGVPQFRKLPKGATFFYYFCRGGRIFLIDNEDMGRKTVAGIRAAIGAPPGGFRFSTDEPDKLDLIAAHFEKQDISTESLRIKMVHVRGVGLMRILQLRPEAKGETLDQLILPTSAYRAELRRVKRSADPIVVKFFVWGENDSFRTYVEARDILDAQEIPGSWEPVDATADLKQFIVGGPPRRPEEEDGPD